MVPQYDSEDDDSEEIDWMLHDECCICIYRDRWAVIENRRGENNLAA